jgi:hypothetical protein
MATAEQGMIGPMRAVTPSRPWWRKQPMTISLFFNPRRPNGDTDEPKKKDFRSSTFEALSRPSLP